MSNFSKVVRKEWLDTSLKQLDKEGYIPTDWIVHENGDIEHKDDDNYITNVVESLTEFVSNKKGMDGMSKTYTDVLLGNLYKAVGGSDTFRAFMPTLIEDDQDVDSRQYLEPATIFRNVNLSSEMYPNFNVSIAILRDAYEKVIGHALLNELDVDQDESDIIRSVRDVDYSFIIVVDYKKGEVIDSFFLDTHDHTIVRGTDLSRYIIDKMSEKGILPLPNKF